MVGGGDDNVGFVQGGGIALPRVLIAPVYNAVAEQFTGFLKDLRSLLELLADHTDFEVEASLDQDRQGVEEHFRVFVMFPSGRPEDMRRSGGTLGPRRQGVNSLRPDE